ncbi:hypothetical protein GCM10009661_60960 [Catellatospora chokoriensis]|uniref:Carbonic anhydrase n=2 Tax=Catellatospora chokoriensis TaxID=310353 RepID=A0A8J3KGU8_9ACTN|nr:hypothetical protein Cch02nite_82680 [Catellatospora chokoriensis]
MLADGQHPFVITVACADSRATPEIVFDQGLGDVFDNRVAGNIVDDVVLAGIEYALAHMAPPLLMMLGHERCGAVTAAIDAVRTAAMPAGHMVSIVARLRPVAEAALHRPGDPVANAVRANIRAQLDHVLRRSSLVAELANSGQVQLVGALYDLDTGRVTVL